MKFKVFSIFILLFCTYFYLPSRDIPDFVNYSYSSIDSVVLISVNKANNQIRGTGCIISDNTILTANHVISGSNKVVISLGNKRYETEVMKIMPQKDLALLRIKRENYYRIPVDLPKVRFSEPISGTIKAYAIGNISNKKTYSYGKIAGEESISLNGRNINVKIFQGFVRPGFSGGPVFDSTGDFRGIIIARDKDNGYLISSEDCKKFIANK